MSTGAMKFGIAQYCWKDFESYTPFVQEVADYLTEVLKNRDYGENVKELILGITMYDEATAAFYKKRKPKFTKGKKRETTDGLHCEIEDSLSCEIWLDEKRILATKNKEDFQRYVCDEIVESFDQLKDVKSIKGFPIEDVRKDVAKLLKQKFY